MKNIEKLREEINKIDIEILELLARRIKLTGEIGKYKQGAKLPILDKEREYQVKEMWMKKAKTLGLKAESVSVILQEILAMSKEIQAKR